MRIVVTEFMDAQAVSRLAAAHDTLYDKDLVDKPEDIVKTLREAFYIARSGRPGPVLYDITKDAQNKKCVFKWDDSPIVLPGYRPDYSYAPRYYAPYYYAPSYYTPDPWGGWVDDLGVVIQFNLP